MTWRNYDILGSQKFWGFVALLILAPQIYMVGMVLTFEQDLTASTDLAADKAPNELYTTIYWASEYGASTWHSGNPYIRSMDSYTGLTINITAKPYVLALDMVYLMQIDSEWHQFSDTKEWDWGRYMGNKTENSLLIKDYREMSAYNVYDNLTMSVPETTAGEWYLVFFCSNTGYVGEEKYNYNPDGRVDFTINIIT